MKLPFQSRVALMDENRQGFLETLTNLGGYCTVEQAKALEVANSDTRVLAQLRGLERFGFLRRVADYPAVYQITGSTTRVLGADRRARRAHKGETVMSRLLAVSFYLEARCWPVEFAFDHQQKIDTFIHEECPMSAIPQRGGKPYLWDEFVLCYEGSRIGVAIMDHRQRSPLGQLRGFAKSFSRLAVCLGERLQLLVVTASESRYRLYCRLVHHPAVMKLSLSGCAIRIEPYQVRRATKFLQLLSACEFRELTGSPAGTQRGKNPQDTIQIAITKSGRRVWRD